MPRPSKISTARWPPILVKALEDEHNYIAWLRSGEKLTFTSARAVAADWVELNVDDASFRNWQVRVSDIMIVAEAAG